MRPASVGPMPKHADFDGNTGGDVDGGSGVGVTNEENIVNNNTTTTTVQTNGSDGVKRRSKSATATTRNSVTFSDTVMVQPVKKTPTPRRAVGHTNYHYEEQQREQGCRVINSGLHTNNM